MFFEAANGISNNEEQGSEVISQKFKEGFVY